MRQTIDEQKEENPNQNGRNGTNVAHRKYRACLNSQNRDISKRILVPGVKENTGNTGIGLLFTMASSARTHDVPLVRSILLSPLLCASTREWKLHGDSSFPRKHGFLPLSNWLYGWREHDCRIKGMLMADFQRKQRGRDDRQNTPDFREQRRSVFLASVSLSGVYINSFQIYRVLPISLPRSSDEQKQQKEYSYICRLRDGFVTNRKEAIAGARWEIKESPIVTNISMGRRASISRSEVSDRFFSQLRRHSLHNRGAPLLLSQSSHRSFFGGQV